MVLELDRVAIKAFQTLLVYDMNTRYKIEYIECGFDIIRNEYLQNQILDLTN